MGKRTTTKVVKLITQEQEVLAEEVIRSAIDDEWRQELAGVRTS